MRVPENGTHLLVPVIVKALPKQDNNANVHDISDKYS